jgi:hypothetical protein
MGLIAGQACACAGVGAAKAWPNQRPTGGMKDRGREALRAVVGSILR